ncbi:glycosyl hydrolase family 95 catalytic domain-containing protein [Solitalea lacus]|uniref:glycoside hydrolase family 95 protein n=1 Tax=Solitalea lacus TaxID=2911172 RepID=UPI001EDA6BD2|nr:glycoside hydrolase family 95 protein [Solitalea lacus]UKJ09287.1 glycoside hydrolase family 95 protein [Solitalea lacus]
MKILKQAFTIALLFATSVSYADNGKDLRLWYKQPARLWHAEGLPLGNGRMGAMMMGGINTDTIQFNEISLWSGDNNWDGDYETGDRGFGSYRDFGRFVVDFNNIGTVHAYTRSLNLTTGVQNTSFESNGIKFIRESFASNPDQMLVFRFAASKKGALSGKISMTSAQGAISKANGKTLSFLGEMPNKLKYASKLLIVNEGGSVRMEGNTLVFDKCNSFIVYLDARTNYKPDYNSGWRGDDPMPVIEKEQAAVLKLDYKNLLNRHIKDISRLNAAATIDVGKTLDAVLAQPIDVRLKQYAAGSNDPDLEETIFQYGRYLLVSSSRPGSLPANLQGLWNNSNNPPWASDYHNNINVQMNYWAAESTNLSECHVPLIDFIIAAQEPCRIATRKAFGQNTRGWTARTSQSIYGGNGWEWNIPASAWYAQHVYEHWAFTQDKNYLQQKAYPILKEICNYWEDRLKKMPDGTLLVPNGWSPEHGPREDGVMHDQQLVWDLFQNYLEAAGALGVDADYQGKVKDMLIHLGPNKIGRWGQLQEWQTDRDDPDDQHRHTSHLFAVYPGHQISPTTTPELAKAAIISLRSRSGNYGKNINTPFTVESTIGDSRRSWSWPWRCGMWARLGDGDKAGMMIRGLLKYNTLPNLFTTHPPFQLDGNFGISGTIPEMLLQSHAGEISLLPAIPKSWEAKGSFKGLKARGGFTVECSWENGKVISYKITSKEQKKIKVRVNGEVKETLSVVI